MTVEKNLSPIGDSSEEQNAAPWVSIIMSTYNRAHLLKKSLQCLALQTLSLDLFEIIVINDGSTDNTAAVCEEMVKALPNMRYLSIAENAGWGNALNLGVRQARSDLLIFTDDDCLPLKDWAERMLDALKKHALVAGCIISPLSNFVKLCHNISEFHPFMEGRKAGPVDFIAGANMGFRRSLFEEVGGFYSENTINSDMRFILEARQLGHQIYFIPEAVIIHDPERTSFSSIFKYTAYHGSGTIILRNRYKKLLRTPFVLRSPWLILVAAPVIALKVTAGIFFNNHRNLKYIRTAPVVYALKLAWCWGAARGLREWHMACQGDAQNN